MSGITVATGQRMAPETHTSTDESGVTPGSSSSGAFFKLSFVQIQLLAAVLVFSMSGLVPIEEIGTAIFVSLYTVALSLYVFPNKTRQRPPPLFNLHKWFPLYASAGTVIGLILPVAYVFGGFTRGDQKAVAAATPHLFLLACQLLTENVVVDLNWVSLPVRALIPLLYTARRLVAINAWVRLIFEKDPFSLDVPVWQLFGRALALANGGFWSMNLALFIIPMFLPRAFEKHFEMERGLREREREKAELKGESKGSKESDGSERGRGEGEEDEGAEGSKDKDGRKKGGGFLRFFDKSKLV